MKRTLFHAGFLLVVIAVAGCGTIQMPVNYALPTNEQDDIGLGKAIRLQVVDTRSEINRIGTADEIGKRPIVPKRPVSTAVEEAFRQAFSRVNYVIADSAAAGYQVKIIEFDVNWRSEFGGKVNAAVKFDISVLKNEKAMGTKIIDRRTFTPQVWGREDSDVAAGLLSTTLGQAVEEAVKDSALQALLRRADRPDTAATEK